MILFVAFCIDQNLGKYLHTVLDFEGEISGYDSIGFVNRGENVFYLCNTIAVSPPIHDPKT